MIPSSSDALFDGALSCRQPRDGYRFSVDAVLAAHFIDPSPRARVLDLCAGCGVIGLIMAYRHPGIQVTAVELQRDLADLARSNVQDNGFAERCTVVEADARDIECILPAESFDMVVCNPPYREIGQGRISEKAGAAIARHELAASMDDFLHAAAYAVKNRSSVVVIYPAARLAQLVENLKRRRLGAKKIQFVYGYPGCGDAALVLVEAVKNGGAGTRVMEPFYTHAKKNGPFAGAMMKLYER